MQNYEFNPDKNEFIANYQKLKSGKNMSEYYGVSFRKIYSYAQKINYRNTLKKDISWKPQDKEEFIKLYNQLKSSTLMAEHYRVSKKTILKYAKSIGFRNEYRNSLTKEEVNYVLESYHLKKAITISKELGVSKSLITKTWRINNLSGKTCRRYYINEDYFFNIDTKDKAYFLGIIASDGCVYYQQNPNKLKMLSFQFNIKDREIIDSFLYYTEAEYKPIIKNKYISLQINSDKIVNDLEKYNIVQRKTWIYVPYFIDDQLMWHYLRGYFDGDGSIYLCGKVNPSNWIISICGNECTMHAFQNFLRTHGIESYVRLDNRKEKYKYDFYNLIIRKNSEKIKFIQMLYNDSENLRLNRKYLKCVEFLKLYNERHPN